MARVRSDLQSPICHLNHPLLQANDNKGDHLPELHQYLAAGTPRLAGGAMESVRPEESQVKSGASWKGCSGIHETGR